VVTFVFIDVEGSTRLLETMGAEAYAEQLMHHRESVRSAAASYDGREVGTQGDGFFLAFPRASDALAAAGVVQTEMVGGPIRVRIGVHSGAPLVVDDDYVGLDVNKAARVCAAAHGGQVLVSQTAAELAGAKLRDLGEYRLRDLAAAERLFQLGDGDFPPLRTLRRANLPVQPTPLIGRQRELADLLGLIRRQRLLTLTGPGGSGKTRLALQLAAEVADEYRDGVWWVALAAISDPSLVLPTIAQALGAGGDLAEFLAGRQILLLLDNIEQVLDAGPSLSELLAAAPGAGMLVTSRQRLGVSEEQEYPVPALDDAAAIELFATRARQVKPDFQPDGDVGEICRRLDRLPLALELASTRVKLLTSAQILVRLKQRFDLLTGGGSDRPGRHRTMHAAIDWSYGLLSVAEGRVFRSLSVFWDSFDLEAAEGVCGADLDMMQSLIDKSLVRATGEDRFFLLETTREYALDRLDAAEGEQLRRRHADWYFQFVRSSRPREEPHVGVLYPPEGPWPKRLAANIHNFRAALTWALDNDIRLGVELAIWLPWTYQETGHVRELADWFDRAFARADTIDPETRAWGLWTRGWALHATGQRSRGVEAAIECLSLFRQENNHLGEASALSGLGALRWSEGALEEAADLEGQALAIFRQSDDRLAMACSLHNLADIHRDAGEFARASALLEEAVEITQEYGHRNWLSSITHSLGDLALDRGDLQEAARRYRQALIIALECMSAWTQAYCLAGLACVSALGGETGEAGRLWSTVESFERDAGVRLMATERQRYETALAPFEDDPAFQQGKEIASTTSLEQVANTLIAN
jgi:predicted ATPase